MSTKLALLCTLTCWSGGIAAFSDKNHPRTLRCGWAGLRCGSRDFDFPFIYPFSTLKKKKKKKTKKSVMSALCHELLTWPIDASRGGVARWKDWERWLSARVTVERGVWLDLGWITHARILLSWRKFPAKICCRSEPISWLKGLTSGWEWQEWQLCSDILVKCRRYMDLKGEKTRTESQRHVRRWTRRVKMLWKTA